MDASSYDLKRELTIDAEASDVFDWYTDPGLGPGLFAGDPSWVVNVDTDRRIGGHWNITMSPPAQPSLRESNVFTEIDRPRRLAFHSTLVTSEGANIERDVEATFESAGPGRTHMTIVQVGFPSEELRDLVAGGVQSVLERLQQIALRRGANEDTRGQDWRSASMTDQDQDHRSQPDAADDEALVTAVARGDERAFTELTERYRRQLEVHCYRMLGSIDDAEDVVQETLLHAWRARSTFQGRSRYRTWLFRIATNACLDLLRGRPRRVLPPDLGPAGDPAQGLPNPANLPWLEPYPDHLLESPGPTSDQPESVVVARETIELAFLVAIQALPPRQRAALIAREMLSWSSEEIATLLGVSVAAANSVLQRARSTMRRRLTERPDGVAEAPDRADAEAAILRRYIEAHEAGDIGALAALLRDDVRLSMPPMPVWYQGATAVVAFHRGVLDPGTGHILGLATMANRQPVAALYLRAAGQSGHEPLALDVLRIEAGAISDITSFVRPDLFASFGLPARLP